MLELLDTHLCLAKKGVHRQKILQMSAQETCIKQCRDVGNDADEELFISMQMRKMFIILTWRIRNNKNDIQWYIAQHL